MTYDEFKEWFHSQELPMSIMTLKECVEANKIKSAVSYYAILLALDDAMVHIDIGEKDRNEAFLSRMLNGMRGEDEKEETDGVPCINYISRYDDYMLDTFLKVLEATANTMQQDLVSIYDQYNLMLNYYYRPQREKKPQEKTEKGTCDAN